MNRPKDWYLSRRQVVAAGAMLATGCVAKRPSRSLGRSATVDAGSIDDAAAADVGVIDLGDPELSSNLWQTMCPYVRAGADGVIGTRANIYNPSDVRQRVLIQVFDASGVIVAVADDSLAAGRSWHIELDEFLVEHRVALPFEGSFWVGTTPQSGRSFLGLQGTVFDWYDRTHLASVHGMRDFGNSNRDTVWSDLILPKVVAGPRFATRVAILNGSPDGLSEALTARPEVTIRRDDGSIVTKTSIDPLGPHASVLLDVRDLIGGAQLTQGTIQITEPEAGLIANGFVFDGNNDGIVTADHFFDRHFVTHTTGFTG